MEENVIAKSLKSFYALNGTRRKKMVPRTPQQNGVVEWMKRTIIEQARNMMLHAGLPKQFWTDAINISAH